MCFINSNPKWILNMCFSINSNPRWILKIVFFINSNPRWISLFELPGGVYGFLLPPRYIRDVTIIKIFNIMIKNVPMLHQRCNNHQIIICVSSFSLSSVLLPSSLYVSFWMEPLSTKSPSPQNARYIRDVTIIKIFKSKSPKNVPPGGPLNHGRC